MDAHNDFNRGQEISLVSGAAGMPALFAPTPAAAKRTLEFFAANIRNPNTRKAYARAVDGFAAWCALHGLRDLAAIEPVHVAAYIEQLQRRLLWPIRTSLFKSAKLVLV